MSPLLVELPFAWTFGNVTVFAVTVESVKVPLRKVSAPENIETVTLSPAFQPFARGLNGCWAKLKEIVSTFAATAPVTGALPEVQVTSVLVLGHVT